MKTEILLCSRGWIPVFRGAVNKVYLDSPLPERMTTLLITCKTNGLDETKR